MAEREFSTAAIASLMTGILLCGFSEMHEAAEYLLGRPIWTHQFADSMLLLKMREKIAEQCPNMPTYIKGANADNYREKLAEIEAIVGKTVRIRKGDGEWRQS